MIKGVQKNMICVQTPKSTCFEEAYFVVRKDLRTERTKGNEMLREAHRILTEHEEMKRMGGQGGKSKRESLLLFFGGVFSGGFLVTLLWMLCEWLG
jgi:hypothetical protein